MKKLVYGIVVVLVTVALLDVGPLVAKDLKTALSPAEEVEKELKRICAAGEPLTFEEAIGPAVPDDENAALVYAKAFEMLKSEEVEEDIGLLREFSKNWKDDDKLSKQTEAVIAKYAPVIEILEQAAQLPQCRFKIDYSIPVETTCPHFLCFKRAATILQSHALLCAKKGDTAGVVRDVELICQLSEDVQSEDSICFYVGFFLSSACIRLATLTIHEVISEVEFSEQEIAQMDKAFESVDLYSNLSRAFVCERLSSLWLFDDIEKNGLGCWLCREGGWYLEVLTEDMPKPNWPDLLAQDKAFLLKESRKAIDAAKVPMWKLKYEEPSREDYPDWAIVSSLSITTDIPFKVRDRYVSEIALARTVLALQRYKQKFGSYPDTLDMLGKKLKWQNPIDPFSGKELVYNLSDREVVIYSIGEDLEDNKGLEIPLSDWLDEPYDIVWRIER